MTITLSMRNVASVDVKTIMLRKFFQMVFVGNDRKSLHIYTATVIGASTNPYKKEDLDAKKNFVSDFKNIPDFRILFDYTVSGNDTNAVTYVKHEDITGNSKEGLFSQIKHLRKVWGNKCTLIYNDQKELNDAIKNAVGNDVIDKTASLLKHNVLVIDEEKDLYPFFFKTCAVVGKVTEVDIGEFPRKKEDYTKRDAYAIDVPDIDLPDGIELVNWVRTTISFKAVIDDKDFNYCLQNPSGQIAIANEELPSDSSADIPPSTAYGFLCPDYTWYFSPPIKSFIDHRNASVEIKKTHSVDNCRNCPCEYRTALPAQNSSKKYHDGIGAVPNKLTVEFDYWVKEERINSRQKYRFAAKELSLGVEEFSSVREILICLDMTDDHSRGNRQYIMGLLISFALSFGIDSSRLSAVENYFPSPLGFNADTLWLLFLVIFSLCMLCRPPKMSDKIDILASGVRKICIFTSLAWFFFVFSLTSNACVQEWINANQASISSATSVAYTLIVSVEIIYLMYLKIRHQDRIFAGLFGEDIL